MKSHTVKRFQRNLLDAITAFTVCLVISIPVYAAPTYSVKKVLVAEDQWQGEDHVIDPAPLYKPHETDASLWYWISSNERGGEGEEEPAVASRAGITIFSNWNNHVLSQLDIENLCIPVVQPNGSLGDCAPPGAEEHPRHPHGIDIDVARNLAYQVLEHSGLKWNATRTGFEPAATTDEESGLLLVYDIRNPQDPRILEGYVLGHAAEEDAVNEVNGKVYVGNHEPSPTNVPCFVSVINRRARHPYIFIDLPDETQCVQGIAVDEALNTVNGTTHIGQKMYTFNSGNDSIAYSVDIRGPFEQQVQGLTGGIPEGWVLHMHDLATDGINHKAYQTIHTIASPVEVDEEDEESSSSTEEETGGTSEETGGTEEEAAEEITGRWVAEVNTDPRSRHFKQVRIIDLSNGQTADAVPTHEDNGDDVPFENRFVHAHFVAVDPFRHALLVTGEHTGNLGVVDTRSRRLQQVIGISRPIPGCERVPETDPDTGLPEPLGPAEPHVHGVNIQFQNGTAYVSDEGENCFYESVTILQ